MNTTESPYRVQDIDSNKTTLPDRFVQVSPTELEIRGGGGFLSLFGLPFLAAGVFMLLASAGVVRMENADSMSDWSNLGLAAMGLVFAAAGAVFVFGRSWIRIDQARGAITRCKGLLVPIWRTELRLGDYRQVTLTHQPGDSDTSERYPVVLQGQGAADLNLSSPALYANAYDQAVYLAEFLRLPLEDSTSGTVRRYQPGQLRESFQERLRAEDTRGEFVAQPVSMRSTVNREGDRLVITIPAERMRLIRIVPAAVGISVAVYFFGPIHDFLDQTRTPSNIGAIVRLVFFSIVVVFPLLGLLGAFLRSRLGYARLTVSRERMTIARRGIVRVRTEETDLSDLLDIDIRSLGNSFAAYRSQANLSQQGSGSAGPSPLTQYPNAERFVRFVSKYIPSRGVILKSRKGIFEFGAGLPEDEIAYLAAQIRSWIREH